MIRNWLIFLTVLFSAVLPVSADPWNPTPLVIDCPASIQYDFDGSNINIPFSTSGKPAMIWLVINTKLPDAQKPVAVTNGFKGWHFVNGIDTTVYVSAGEEFQPGTGHVISWNGYGDEKQ
jgi:hypothetical protein